MKKLTDFEIMPIFPMAPVSDPQVSPDGTRVLFTHSTVNMEEDKYDSHIWLLDLKEKRPRQFTHGANNESFPRWSPDGKQILFLSNRTAEGEKKDEKKKKKSQIWVIPADGGEARQITTVEEGAQSPVWSPDGKSILFLCKVFKGEKATDESDVKIIRRMEYKADGKGFSVEMYVHMFTVPAKGGKVKQLTDGEYDVEEAEWSPDGKKMAFVANMGEDADKSFYRDIYSIPAKGGEPELLLKGFGRVGSLGWSPCGERIAFVGRRIEDPSLVWHKNNLLWVMPSEGGEPRCLTAGFDRTVSMEQSVEWSPDSKHLYVRFPHHGGAHVYRVSMEGDVEQVTEGNISVGSFSIDESGKVFAFNASEAVTPSELWVDDGDGARKRTEMNKDLLKKLRLSEPEEFWFTASDGVEVQGWILKPRGFQEGVKYPTLIEIHGGPRSAYGFKLDSAEHEFQVLADNGYVVVYTNPRASIGYGEQFAGLISGHWGERDYQDIMEATDYIIENYPYVDPERVGVLGGSYGGFMTNWIVGHTDRYKAAVTQRSISNWYSFHGTSDIGWMTLPTHELINGKDPWDDLELCMEKSPITYVKNIKTPLLIIHSEADYRCPMEQGEQLFIALKKLGKTTEFVRFPDEPHGLSRTGKPKHRVERLQHIVRWFDRYLK
jgi:dipeptidyl aminopeptidase/acylaminoacyl peptidase